MRNNLKPQKNCVVCNSLLNKRDILILKKSTFCQSWCELCIIKNSESYPNSEIKLNAHFELLSIERQIKYNNE